MRFWRALADGVMVSDKVQPKSRRPGGQGRVPAGAGERLRIGVCEAAEGGRANKAACATLAGALGIAASLISVVQGATSREKTLRIMGDPALLRVGLERL